MKQDAFFSQGLGFGSRVDWSFGLYDVRFVVVMVGAGVAVFFVCFVFVCVAARRAWAAAAIEAEHRVRVSQQFLAAMTNSLWFTDRFVSSSAATLETYEIVCPFAHAGCAVVCPRRGLAAHLLVCAYAHGVAQRERDAMSSGPYADGAATAGKRSSSGDASSTGENGGNVSGDSQVGLVILG